MSAPWPPPAREVREGPCRCSVCRRRRVAAIDAQRLTGPEIGRRAIAAAAIWTAAAFAYDPAGAADALLTALGVR